jgi:SOS-response transcriptional repressor LexA
VSDEFVVRLKSDRLAPEIQAGDTLTVREADTAEPGQLAVVLADDRATVERYSAQGRVLGVVTNVYRDLR